MTAYVVQQVCGTLDPTISERADMAFSEFLFGTDPRIKQIPRYTPEQEKLLQWLMQYIQQGVENPQAGFEPIEALARRQFEQKTIPTIAERFAGLNALSSSGFKGSLGQAASDLETNLAAQRAMFGMQNRGQLFGGLGAALSPRFENAYQPGTPGLAQQLMASPGILGGLGALGSSIFSTIAPQMFGYGSMPKQQDEYSISPLR